MPLKPYSNKGPIDASTAVPALPERTEMLSGIPATCGVNFSKVCIELAFNVTTEVSERRMQERKRNR